MVQDLFQKKSAKQRLYEWLRKKDHAKTSEILYWGATAGYSNRADRNARQLAKEGLIRRMPKAKRISYYGNIKEEAWEVIRFTDKAIPRMGNFE